MEAQILLTLAPDMRPVGVLTYVYKRVEDLYVCLHVYMSVFASNVIYI